MSLELQTELFNGIRDGIDRELRATGFEEFIAEHDINPTDGRLVVARFSIYSSDKAMIDIDLDPLSPRVATQYEVGVSKESKGSRYYRGIPVSEALDGQQHELFGEGNALDYIQFISVVSSIVKLRQAKATQLPYLTKSLKKIDPFGD